MGREGAVSQPRLYPNKPDKEGHRRAVLPGKHQGWGEQAVHEGEDVPGPPPARQEMRAWSPAAPSSWALLRICIPQHPPASIWNRAAAEGDKSSQKVMVQLERIKETTEINQFQEGGKIHIFYCSPNKNIKHKQIKGLEVLPARDMT